MTVEHEQGRSTSHSSEFASPDSHTCPKRASGRRAGCLQPDGSGEARADGRPPPPPARRTRARQRSTRATESASCPRGPVSEHLLFHLAHPPHDMSALPSIDVDILVG